MSESQMLSNKMFFSPGRKEPKVPCGQRFAWMPFTGDGGFSARQKTCFTQWTHPSDKQVFLILRAVLRKKPDGGTQSVYAPNQAITFGGQGRPAPCWPTFHGGQPDTINLFCFIYPVLCQQIDASVRPRTAFPAVRTRAFCFFFAREKEKGKRKGRIVAVLSAGDSHTFS